jgi:hypothetical protein
MPGAHSFPDTEQDLVDLCLIWKSGLENPLSALYKWDPEELTPTLNGITAFLTARTAYAEDDSSKNRRAKNEAKKAVKKLMQDFANTSIRYNKHMTEADREHYGIYASDSPSPIQVPKTSPRLIIDTGTRRRIIIYYKDEKSSRRGKPKGVHGIEVRWAILDHPPKDVSELIHSSFDTRAPLILEFEEHDRGKKIYLCGSWEIEREGLKGPPGAIEEAIIP